MDGFMTWEDVQGISQEQQLLDLARDYRHMSDLLDQATSDPEAFLELCHQAQQQAAEGLDAGNLRLIHNWEWEAEHFPTLRNMVRCFTGQRLEEERRK